MTAASAPLSDAGALPLPAVRTDWLHIARVLLLLVLPCACYWPALNGEFLWDDGVLILNNPLLGSLDGLRRIWFSTVPLDYFPLTYTSFWVEKWFWGADSAGYHLVNLALHVTAAFLLWRLLRALQVPGAWFGALLFAVHPVNVASVAWLAERKNVLSMVFYFASLLRFVHWRARAEAPGAEWSYLAALGWFVLAALSKSSVVMLPCALLLLVWWQDGRMRRRDLVRAVPFFALALAFGLLTLWFQHHRAMSAATLTHSPPPGVRALTAARALWFYLGKVLFPHPLAMLYPRWQVRADDPWAYVAPLRLAALFAVCWWMRRMWGRAPLAAVAYFVVTLLPVSGLVSMSFFGYSNVSDHLVYLSTPVVCALVAALLAGWQSAGGRHGQLALAAMTLLAGLACVGCTARAGDFSGVVALWRSTLAINPRCYAAHNNLGQFYQNHSRQDPRLLLQAESQYRAALAIDYDLETAGVNLANVLRMEGRWSESAALYREILLHYPEPESYNNYGVALLKMGDNATARGAFYEALRLDPVMVSAYRNLYLVERAENHLPQACAMLRACLRINPDDVAALNAFVRLALDQPGQAPPSAPAAELLIATADRACQLTQHQQAESLLLLSKALLAAGRQPEAISVAAKAHAAADALHDSEMVAAIAAYRRSLLP